MSIKSLSHPYYTRIYEASSRVKKSGKILDVGCADGYLDTFLKKKGKVFGADINKTELEIAKAVNPDVSYLTADINKLPFKSNYFDTVVCLEVLEHIENDNRAISELFRVLKKNGTLVISVPSSDFPISFDFINFILKRFNLHTNFGVWAYGHKRLYLEKEIRSKLEKNSFRIVEISHMSHFLVGFIEPTYIINIIQPFFKSDSKNMSSSSKNSESLKKRIQKEPPLFLARIRDFIIRKDEDFFKKSKHYLGILVVAKKQ
jgi:ubiquinone/menaquinone biosynthesis C-methylase UbiE